MTMLIIEEVIDLYHDVSANAHSLNRLASEGGDNHADLLELFESIAESSEGTVYEGYSGRCMYGKTCWGITGDATKILEVAGAHGVFGASMDSMGLGSIVYWPKFKYNSAE